MRSSDPAFPQVHVRPRLGWVDDPNGPVQRRGRCYLFFQHNPAAPVHADVHWGRPMVLVYSCDDLTVHRLAP